MVTGQIYRSKMIYDTSKSFELQKFDAKCEAIKKKKGLADLKDPVVKRSISQNSYVHVLFTLYGIEFGLTIKEAKTLVKRSCEFMKYTKDGNTYLKSTASLSVDEMVEFVDWFRNWSAKEGCYLPSSEEYIEEQTYFQQQINNNKKYQ